MADNSPFASRELQQLTLSWRFQLITSIPGYPQSNGISERKIGIINQLLREAEDAYVPLMECCNSPVTGISLSPSNILKRQRLRSNLPTMTQVLRPQVTLNAHEKLGAAHQRQKFYYDRHAKPLKGLEPEETITVRENRAWVQAVITDRWLTPRSYVIKTESRTSLRRNRKHLVKQLESKSLMESDEEGATSATEIAAPDNCLSPNEEVMVAR